MSRYRNVARFAAETPWAITPDMFGVIQEILTARLSGERWSDAEIEARLEAAGGRRPARQARALPGGVAVVPLAGVIMPRANMMSDMSGGTSVQEFTQALSAAMSDPEVGAIVIDVDSPGGSTDLLTEAAGQIRAMRGTKPMLAVADTKMASAAYWLASQADEIAVTPSGFAGSIGVIATHTDTSAANERDGIKPTMISAGKYKSEGNPNAPLTSDGLAHMQSLVDGMYQTFTLDVSKGRGVPVDDIRAGYGEGRMLGAKDAVKAGLADRVATLEQTISRAAGLAAQNAGTLRAVAVGDAATGTNALQDKPPPPDEPATDVTPEAATSGLSFAATARQALDAITSLAADARSFADVRERDRLTAAKREQFAALDEALSDLDQARADVRALLADTDPEKPRREAQALAGAYLQRLHNQRGAIAS